MNTSRLISVDAVCIPSEEVVAREIEGEIIIVPLAAGIAERDDELFTLNETGKAIWDRLDGKRSLNDVADDLLAGFNEGDGDIQADVLGLAEELVSRRILVVVKGD